MQDPTHMGSSLFRVDQDGLYVGLMSGTSMDGIDAALLRFGQQECETIATRAVPYPAELKESLLAASRTPAECNIDRIGHLDHWVGECFADAVHQLLSHADVEAAAVSAIGSHGQTLRHQPRAARPFTMQIGDPNLIAAATGILTVADFRRRDLARGGEGAPLTPAFHRWLFSSDKASRVVVNIGGIGNVTILPRSAGTVCGFDTGPGNTLLDSWCRVHFDCAFDADGALARSGRVAETLLAQMLADPYFAQAPPKSTGFEYFNLAWLRSMLPAGAATQPSPEDVLATLAELSARSIAASILQFAPDVDEVLVCGGGVHNGDLLDRLGASLPGIDIVSTEGYGLHPDWVEAAAFAWLAKRCLERRTGNLPQVTGANQADILGAIYQCAS